MHQGTVLGACVGVASVVACILSVVSWTAISRLRGYNLERFEPESLPSPESLRNKRGDAVALAGLYQFYTNRPPDASNSAMFLYPTPGDVLSILGADTRPRDPSAGTLESISCVDTLFPRGDTIGSCASRVADSVPSRKGVCRVRVFDATYDITKTCMRLSVATSYPATEGDRDTIVVGLQSSAPSTAFFVLLRPLFVSLSGSSLYRVELYSDGDKPPNTLCNYDSEFNSALHLKLSRVKQPAVSTPVDEQHDRHLMKGLTTSADDTVPLNMFFMRFTGQKFDLGTRDTNSGRVLTLYIQLPEDLGGVAALVSLGGPHGGITVGTNNKHIRIGVGSAAFSVGSLPSAFVVITFSDLVLHVAVMTRSRILYRCFVLGSAFHAADYGGTAAVLARLEATTGGTPAGLTPYTNTCIPDLGDIALQMRMFPTRAFRRQ